MNIREEGISIHDVDDVMRQRQRCDMEHISFPCDDNEFISWKERRKWTYWGRNDIFSSFFNVPSFVRGERATIVEKH